MNRGFSGEGKGCDLLKRSTKLSSARKKPKEYSLSFDNLNEKKKEIKEHDDMA